MTFVKLHESLVDSSLWEQPPSTLKVFVALLLKCDFYGDVLISRQALVRAVGLPSEEVIEAIRYLEAPDPFSRDQAEEGRRILPVAANCWHIVNYSKFRAARDDDRERELSAARSRAYRERQKVGASPARANTNRSDVQGRDANGTSRPSRHVEEEGDVEGDQTASAEPDGADSALPVPLPSESTEGRPGSATAAALRQASRGYGGDSSVHPRAFVVGGTAEAGDASGGRGVSAETRPMAGPMPSGRLMPSKGSGIVIASPSSTVAPALPAGARSVPRGGAIESLHGDPADSHSLMACAIPLYGPEPRRWVAVHRDFLEDVEELFPDIDLQRETEKARQWCLDTGKGPGSAAEARKFLVDWYERAQEWKDDPVGCLEACRT